MKDILKHLIFFRLTLFLYCHAINGHYTFILSHLISTFVFLQPDEGKKETEKKGKREKREPKEPKEVSELSKNPIQALNELRPGVITFEMINERGDSHNKMFTFEVCSR